MLSDEELQYVMAHEIGHIMSDHVLYKTMTVLLINLANMGFPVVGLPLGRFWSGCSNGPASQSSRATGPACSRCRTRRS